jgi:hypothetical protein
MGLAHYGTDSQSASLSIGKVERIPVLISIAQDSALGCITYSIIDRFGNHIQSISSAGKLGSLERWD